MARTYNDIYYNDDENSTAEILDDMKKLAESVDQQIGSIKSFNNDTSQFIEQVTPLMNTLSEQVIDMHQLADTMFTELEQVKEENKQLRQDLNGLPKGQASGESIDLSDSAEMRCDLKISGNSKQETREGYNLANYKNSATKSDVNFEIGDIESGKTYTLYLNVQGTLSFNLKYGVNGSNIATSYDITGKHIKTFEASESNVLYMNGFSTTNYNGISEIMLLEGTYTKDNLPVYEAYGASPSPDYPSEVESCGDNINIFDGELEVGAISTSTGEKVDNNKRMRSKNFIPIIPSTSYIMMVDNADFVINKIFYDSDYNFISVITNVGFTTPSNARYMKFYGNNNTGTNDINDKLIKIEEGSATPYSPPGQGCINVVICNKNIFDISKRIYTATAPNTVSVSSSNGIIRASITSGAAHSAYLIGNLKVGQKYTISWKNAINLNSMQLSQSDNNGKQSTQIFRNYNTTDNVTFEATTEYVLLNILASSTTLSIEDVQIEKGSTATAFEEHKSQTYTIPTQQPFRSNGDIRDIFIKKNNKWYERHYIERLILDGTEGWNYDTNNNRFYFAKTGQKGYGYIACSHYLKGDTTKNNNTCEIWTGAILFRNEQFTTINDFKTHLQEQYNAGTPVYVDYVLATPLDIECTEEQSTILFDIEQNAKTYKGVTHIYSTDKISSYKEVTYKKDIETLFENTLVEGVG